MRSGEFYVKYFVEISQIHINEDVRLDPGIRVQLSGNFCGFNARRGMIIINVTSGVVGGRPTYSNGPRRQFLSVRKDSEE
ncbi:hypothetical protein PTTG_29729 [Puccinia triticina 1-1 BBBD Race 1]|uniref:Uncharacterized protein n=2 Tax=Puccinia triticina TaxID=208348 RepID=A0A180G2Z4_PUCT1|nr:uncharacterized protein PtA15_8A147 [Puccinia triticina]OAV86792.1 hypothetical protein PTTG_29729 [Puccinia triticina 1-1 BBBD Race 1]WAQ87244.1 hypothetical protein PtA15_8A147 [Puccinia triticina]WAR52300.1 hypothetical protein PtB15_1B741 [Puccinia triticina]